MAAFAGRKPLRKNANKILGGNTDSRVADDDANHVARAGLDADFNDLLRVGAIIQGVLGVAQEVVQDLKDFTALPRDLWHCTEFALNLHTVTQKRALADLQSVFHDPIDLNVLDESTH